MKKLLFVLAFAFIGGQAFSQIYLVTINGNSFGNCSGSERTITTIDPTGTQTHTCVSYNIANGSLIQLNQVLNSVTSQGYELINVSTPEEGISYTTLGTNYLINNATFIFAIPWTTTGLEEVATTLKSFVISPNPANTFVDISLDYSLKGESEVVFISEAGYISHKESIGEILKNEKYNIDTSKIPAGKYLITIVNGKTYTTPQKLIIF